MNADMIKIVENNINSTCSSD